MSDVSCHHLQSCKIKDKTNICVRCNKKEKILSYNRLFLTRTCLFSYFLYMYLLNLKLYRLIKDDMNYTLIFLLLFYKFFNIVF
jgi:hypothetical protein